MLLPGRRATTTRCARVAETLRAAIAARPIPRGATCWPSRPRPAPRGAAPGGSTAEALVDAADRALYAAKRRGRDRAAATAS